MEFKKGDIVSANEHTVCSMNPHLSFCFLAFTLSGTTFVHESVGDKVLISKYHKWPENEQWISKSSLAKSDATIVGTFTKGFFGKANIQTGELNNVWT